MLVTIGYLLVMRRLFHNSATNTNRPLLSFLMCFLPKNQFISKKQVLSSSCSVRATWQVVNDFQTKFVL